MHGATCCKNDNEVITEEIAYAIVADFPLFRFYNDTRCASKRLNRWTEIAKVAEFMESTGPSFKEPAIEEDNDGCICLCVCIYNNIYMYRTIGLSYFSHLFFPLHLRAYKFISRTIENRFVDVSYKSQ